MTTENTDEAIHFRGKTLTPESPRPLHIPEPSHIPLLQNQMNPVYNEASVFEPQSGVNEGTPNASTSGDEAQGAQLAGHFSSNTYSLLRHGLGDLTSAVLGQEVTGSIPESSKEDGLQSHTEINLSHGKILTEHNVLPVPDASLRVSRPEEQSVSDRDPNNHIDRSMPPQTDPPLSIDSSGYHQSQRCANHTHDSPAAAEPSADDQCDMNNDKSATRALNGDVNYQDLLNSIAPASPAPHTAPSSTTATATPHTAHASSVSFELNTPLPFNLRAHSEPQEKIATPSSYPPKDNTSPLHFTHNPSNGDTEYEPSNFPTPAEHSAIHDPNSLLPTPTVTYEKFQSPDANSAESGEQLLERQSYNEILQGDKQDEAPWAPEVQKKYDEFLQDERVYVTEGLWDRFPLGSRLFVGM